MPYVVSMYTPAVPPTDRELLMYVLLVQRCGDHQQLASC
jgi:hypothetical protein